MSQNKFGSDSFAKSTSHYENSNLKQFYSMWPPLGAMTASSLHPNASDSLAKCDSDTLDQAASKAVLKDPSERWEVLFATLSTWA